MGYVFLRALEGICMRSPILNQLGGMLHYSSNVPFLAPTDLGGKSYMYLPQMSYHPPVLCGQTTQLWSTEKQLTLCIRFFLRSWCMYVLAFYVHIQLQLFNPQWNVLITLRACSRGKVHAIGRVVIMSKNIAISQDIGT